MLVKTVVNLTDSRVFTLVDTTGAISLKVNNDMKQTSKLDLAALTLNNVCFTTDLYKITDFIDCICGQAGRQP